MFISWKNHKAISKDTLSKWIKQVLELLGIDTSIYKAHSTRSAASSAAHQRLDISFILKSAGWSNSQTFATFYNKSIEKPGSFSKAVLKNKT